MPPGGADALRADGIVVPDWPPPFRFAHPDQARHVRAFLPAIEQGLGDREAWEALFTDAKRLEIERHVTGNRKGPLPRRCPHGQPRRWCGYPECITRRRLAAR